MKYWEKNFLSEFVIIIYNIGNFLYRKFLNNKFLMKYLKYAQKMFLQKKFYEERQHKNNNTK